ncbi:MAG: hypothetical protein FWE16_05590 [Firmicutes bacterium]|nr:hypothetical protein [Bacillota bacterium]
MIDKNLYIKKAKEIIKQRFDADIVVEFVEEADAEKRKEELAKIYGRNLDHIGKGFFMEAANGHPPIMLVAYSDEHMGGIDVFHHEFQHAIDYFEVIKALGEKPPHFTIYTEFNASRSGTLRHMMAELETGSPQEIVAFYKPQMIKRFVDNRRTTLIDVVCFMARAQVFAEIEGRMDQQLLALIPQRDKVFNLGNHMNRYESTKEWWTEFEKKVDALNMIQ